MKQSPALRHVPDGSRNLWLPAAVVLLLIGLVTSLAQAEETIYWRPAVNLSNLAGRSFQATIARDPATGDLFVAWTDDGVTEWEEIMGRRWDRAAQAWLPVENLSQSEEWQRDGGPVLIFDHQGHGLLIWTRTYSTSQGAPTSGHDVLWRAWDGGGWSPEAVLYHGDSYLPGSPGTFGLVPVETPASILLFITWDNGYRTADYQDGAWTEVAPWTYLDVSLVQVIVGETGILHAAAFGENSSQWGYNRYFYDAYYLTYDGMNWSEPLNLSFTEGVANNVDMAFDRQGRLHFLWSDPDSSYSDESLKSAIWERVYENEIWTPNTEVTAYNPDQAINGFSLTADVTGTLHLAWSEGFMDDGAHTELDIYYRTGGGTTWGTEEPVFASDADSRYPLVRAGGGNAYLVWQEVLPKPPPQLPEQEIYFSQEAGVPPDRYWTHLPLVSK